MPTHHFFSPLDEAPLRTNLRKEINQSIREAESLFKQPDDSSLKNLDQTLFKKVKQQDLKTAKAYQIEIHETSDENLLPKVLRDYIVQDKTSALYPNNDLRDHIGRALCKHFKIDEKIIANQVIALMQTAGSSLGGAAAQMNIKTARHIIASRHILYSVNQTYEEVMKTPRRTTQSIEIC